MLRARAVVALSFCLLFLPVLAGCADRNPDLAIPGHYSLRPGAPGTLVLTKQVASGDRILLELAPEGPAEVRWRLEFSDEYFPFEDTFYWGEGAFHFQTLRRDPSTFLSLSGVLGDGREEPLDQEGDWSYGFKGTEFFFPSPVAPPPGAEGEGSYSRGGWSVLAMKGPAANGASVALVMDEGTWVRMHGASSGPSFGPQAFLILGLLVVVATLAFPRPRRFLREAFSGVRREREQSKKQSPPPQEPAKRFDPLGRERQKNN